MGAPGVVGSLVGGGEVTSIARRGAAQLLDVERARDLLARASTVDDAKGIADKAEALAVWLRRQGAAIESQQAAAEITLRAERRVGELAAKLQTALRARGKRGRITMVGQAKREQLEAAGLSKQRAHRAEKLASIPASEFESRLAAAKLQGKISRSQLLQSSYATATAATTAADYDSDEWYTDPELIESARVVLGRIELDVASCAAANRIVRADHYFTKKDDALSLQWWGGLWMNCPFSKTSRFVEGFVEEWQARRVRSALLLFNGSTDTEWFHRLLGLDLPVCLTRGRRGFIDRSGRKVDGNRVGQAVFYAGPKRALFRREFRKYGEIVARVR